LHTLNSGPSSTAYADCLRLLGADDALLLTGDGTYCAAADTRAGAAIAASGAAVYYLAEHAAARGVAATDTRFTAIDIDRFVALTEQFPKQLAWF
jgi:tRNA 2-thiouridine synthesizing protein B